MIDSRAQTLFAGFDEEQKVFGRYFLLIRLLQQANQFLFKNPATGLTILESSLLLEIDARKLMTTQLLANLFEVKQSTMSRNLDKLISKGLIAKTASPFDSRNKTIAVTPKGAAVLKKHDALSNAIIATYEKRLPKGGALKLSEAFNRISDDFHILPAARRAGEHPIRSAMRRLSFLLGITRSAGFMGSSLSALSWQVVSEVFLRGEVLSIREFAHSISIPQGNAIQLISRLEEMGLIEKLSHSGDRRKTSFSCTPKGIKAIQKILEFAVKKFQSLCKPETVKAIMQTESLLQRMIGRTPYGDWLIGKEMAIVSLQGSQQLQQARKFILNHLHAYPTRVVTQHEFASPNNYVFGILKNASIVGVVEASQGLHKKIVYSDFFEDSVLEYKHEIHKLIMQKIDI